MTGVVYFAGTEKDAFNTGGVSCLEQTSARFDSAVVRSFLGFATGPTLADTDYWEGTLVDPTTGVATAQTTVWIHAELYGPNSRNSATTSLINCMNSSGVSVFRIWRQTSGSTWQMQFWDGAAYQDVGAAFNLSIASELFSLDLKIICGASGSASLHVAGNETAVASGSITDADCNNIANVRFHAGFNSQANMGWSQMIAASVKTIGWKYYSRPPTGNGANTTWSGAFGDVDEAVTNDTDYTQSTSADEIETYTHAAITLPAGEVKAVVLPVRCLTAASGPQNIQMVVRRGGTNYPSYTLPAPGAGFSARLAIMELDPSTGIAWTIADAGSASTEHGMKSKA